MRIFNFIEFINESKKDSEINIKNIKRIPSGGIEDIDYSDKDKKVVDYSPLNKKDKKDNGYRGKKITYAESQVFTKKLLLTTEDGVKVYKVDAQYIRDNIDIDMTMGGHGYVYPNYIPENEVWIDDSMDGLDIMATTLHELVERGEMKTNKLSYSKAHEIASKKEKEFRNKYGKKEKKVSNDETKDKKEVKK